jgi:hypothetical protein
MYLSNNKLQQYSPQALRKISLKKRTLNTNKKYTEYLYICTKQNIHSLNQIKIPYTSTLYIKFLKYNLQLTEEYII